MNWIMDYCAQAMRKMVIGLGGRANGYTMESGFNIAVSSECMAILSIATDLADLRERLNNMTVAFDLNGNRVTTGDLKVGGAMTAWMRNTINPTLMCTAEYQPCFVHAGPFANIAVGQSSIISDRIGLKMFDYHVTESGFAADIGFEKFWNVKCRNSGLKPHVSVLTATIRALKMHGGGPKVTPGLPLPEEYTKQNLDLLDKGMDNMRHLIGVIRKSGMNPVVCVNVFPEDTKEEIELVKKRAEEAGARCAASTHFMDGGDGALELADAVMDACEEESQFEFLYSMDTPLRERVDIITREVYGGDGVDWLPEAEKKAKMLEADPQFKDYSTMMAKTHLSLSHEPTWKGVPKGWRLPVRDIYIYSGSKFLVPVAGTIPFMPGTSSNPAYTKVDVDPDTGNVSGLF
jgi:formate--tetrahydrofolate ligase